MLERIKGFWGIIENKTSIQTEVLAGVSTFLALSYIFVVNPAILSQAGMDKRFVLFATIIASSLATLAMGLWARLPFALAPGMEMNAYVAFFVVGTLGFSWQQALGAVFWSGILFVVLTISRVREKVIDAIPDRMKSGLSLSVGVFLCLIALKIPGLLCYEGVQAKGLGNFASLDAYAFYASFVLILLLEKLRVRGSVMISIIITTVLCHLLGNGGGGEAAELSSAMFSGIGQLDLSVIVDPKILSVILILFLIDFYGSIAKLIGLTLNTSIMVGGKLPRIKEALLIDSVATTAGSSLGTTSITVYVESGVGIGTGGRTGLTAVVCGLLMLSCFLVAPFLKFVPVVATSGALLFVGIKLCPPLNELRTYSRIDVFVMALMQVVVILTFAIDRAMLVGFVVYILMDLVSLRKPNPYLVGSTVLLAGGTVLQIM